MAAERMRRWQRRLMVRQSSALAWLADNHPAAQRNVVDVSAYEAGVFHGVKAMVAVPEGGLLTHQLANTASDALRSKWRHRQRQPTGAFGSSGAARSADDGLLGMCDGAYFELVERTVASEVSLEQFRHKVANAVAAAPRRTPRFTVIALIGRASSARQDARARKRSSP